MQPGVTAAAATPAGPAPAGLLLTSRVEEAEGGLLAGEHDDGAALGQPGQPLGLGQDEPSASPGQ